MSAMDASIWKDDKPFDPGLSELSELTKAEKAKWVAAVTMFQKIKDRAAEESADIMYDGTIIRPDQIEIGEKTIYVRLNDRMRVIWFEVKKNWDHGLYTPIKKFEKEVRESFKLVKTMEF